jgi:hypothetical protein
MIGIYDVCRRALYGNLIYHWKGYIRAKFHVAIERAACEACSATQSLLSDRGKAQITLNELAGRRTFRMQTDFWPAIGHYITN